MTRAGTVGAVALGLALGCSSGSSAMSSAGAGAGSGTAAGTGGASTSGSTGTSGGYPQYGTLSGAFAAPDAGLAATFSGAVVELSFPASPKESWTAVVAQSFAPDGVDAGLALDFTGHAADQGTLAFGFPSVLGVPAATTLTCGEGGVDIALFGYPDGGHGAVGGQGDGGDAGLGDAGDGGKADGGADEGLLRTDGSWLFVSNVTGASCTVTLDAPTLVQSAIVSAYFAHGSLSATLVPILPDGGADPTNPAMLSATW